jgi:hypothetical protein
MLQTQQAQPFRRRARANGLVNAIITPTANGWTIDLAASANGAYLLEVTSASGLSHTTIVK